MKATFSSIVGIEQKVKKESKESGNTYGIDVMEEFREYSEKLCK